MSFLRRVARDVSRDIQVIIKEASGGSRPKRQRYDPKKAKRKPARKRGKYIPRADFLKRLQEKYSDKGTEMNTQDSARDPSRSYGTILQAMRDYVRRVYGATLVGSPIPMGKGVWHVWIRSQTRKTRMVMVTHSDLSRKTSNDAEGSRTSRDFTDDVRHLSLSALGRLLRQYHQRGDEEKCHVIEKEIDRRTKAYFGKGKRR